MDGVWLTVKLHLHMRGEQYSEYGLDLCHNSAREKSYFKHAKFCGENVHLRKKKVFQRTRINCAFKICFWICADLLFCVCSVSLACSPDARSQCSLNTDRSLAQHSVTMCHNSSQSETRLLNSDWLP